MGGESKSPDAKNGRGSSTRPKRGAIDALRYGPAPLPKRANTQRNLVTTLGAPGWITGCDEDRDDGQGKECKWRLGPTCGSVLAISAGREELRCALVRPDGRLIKQQPKRLYIVPPSRQPKAGPDDFVKALAALLRKCVAGGEHAPIVAVAIAWPGRVDPTLNEGRGDPHLSSYEGRLSGMPLSDLVKAALARASLKGDPPIYVINDADANLMALAHPTRDDQAEFPDPDDEELLGERPGLPRIQAMINASSVTLGVTIAGGVGGALMLAPDQGARRAVHPGSHGFVGELGQIPIDVTQPEAEKATNIAGMTSLKELKEKEWLPRWNCVHKETLDHYASGRSVVEQLYDKLEGGYNGRILKIKERLEAGDDAELQHVMDRSGRLIGQALIGPSLTIDPDLIVISSFAWSEDLLEGIRQALWDSAARVGLAKRSIVLAPVDPARTVKGAARWAIEQRISPILEEVCARGNGNNKFEDLKSALFQGAIFA